MSTHKKKTCITDILRDIEKMQKFVNFRYECYYRADDNMVYIETEIDGDDTGDILYLLDRIIISYMGHRGGGLRTIGSATVYQRFFDISKFKEENDIKKGLIIATDGRYLFKEETT